MQAQLPSVAHDFPAAVLLIDSKAEQVVFANDLASQLAPDLTFPIQVEDWSRAAGLQVVSGGQLTESSTPLTALAGDPASYAAEVLDKRVSVLDLLERYPACQLAFASFVALLGPLTPRQYSISSSPKIIRGELRDWL